MSESLSLWAEKVVSLLPSASSWTLVTSRAAEAASLPSGARWTLKDKGKLLFAELVVVPDVLSHHDLATAMKLPDGLVKVQEVKVTAPMTCLVMNTDPRVPAIWGLTFIRMSSTAQGVLQDLQRCGDEDLTFGEVYDICKGRLPTEGSEP